MKDFYYLDIFIQILWCLSFPFVFILCTEYFSLASCIWYVRILDQVEDSCKDFQALYILFVWIVKWIWWLHHLCGTSLKLIRGNKRYVLLVFFCTSYINSNNKQEDCSSSVSHLCMITVIQWDLLSLICKVHHCIMWLAKSEFCGSIAFNEYDMLTCWVLTDILYYVLLSLFYFRRENYGQSYLE